MEFRELMVPAAEVSARIVGGVPEGALDAPTPCPEWDVRALLNHMIFWTGRGEPAARKQAPAPGPGEDHDFVADGDWAALYAELARKGAEAWTDPAAWEGTTSLTGNPDGMPSAMIGGMLLGEHVMHGWDLAVATGQDPAIPDDLVRAAHGQLAATAEMAREYKVIGPEVPVPESAPPLDRLLGLSGRDPYWKP